MNTQGHRVSNPSYNRFQVLANNPLPSTGACLAAAVLLLLAAPLCWGTTEGRVTLSPNYVNFGGVPVNTSKTVTITVENTGNAPVVFSGDALSAASQFTMSGFAMPFSLGADQSVTFTLTFSPTAVGAESGTITFLTNAANRRVVMRMNGAGVEPSVSATPASASFGNVLVGVTDSQTIELQNTGTSAVTISSISASGTGFATYNFTVPLLLEPGATSTFNIAFEPQAAGAVTGSASVQGNFPTVVVPVSGTGVAGTKTIAASTTSENFGSVTVGSSASAVITLTDTGTSSVTISALSYSGAGISASGAVNAVLSPGQSTSMTVTFAPTQAGSVAGSVVVTSTASDSPLDIAVSGIGAAANTTYSVDLSWAASASSGVTGYDVYRSTVSGGPYTLLDPTPVAALDYSDSSVQSGTEYFYVVTSVESNGTQSAYSTQISVSIP